MTFNRRHLLALALGSLASPAFGQSIMSTRTAYGFSFGTADGQTINLADHTDKPILVVNTATLCGYAPQLSGLQNLWASHRERGLLVLGVPSNDFGGQEPGADKDIVESAHHQYGVSFPMAAKVAVLGSNAHPFYKWAAAERPKDLPRWNFHKYLIGRDGHVADVFSQQIEPTDTRIITAIARQLGDSPIRG
jgi:glutathione peroxidase